MPKKKAAPVSAPRTVAERRRLIRATKTPGPKLAKTKVGGDLVATVDLTAPNARKLLVAMHPSPKTETILAATAIQEAAALEYFEQRDAEKRASTAKEIAGNQLCAIIGTDLGVRGDGWIARWGTAKGNVDWAGVVKELNISDDVIARHRHPDKRVLDVDELPEE